MALINGIVKLNVGGTIFQTTNSTLTRFDGYFKAKLKKNASMTKDETGAFFIDRSPKHFDLILNFMRDGDVKIPSCEEKIEEILREAQYYELTDLVELCTNHSRVNTEMFKILRSELEVFHAVHHSKKPVAVICVRNFLDLFGKNVDNGWKKFIERNSQKWNIIITKEKSHSIMLHADKKQAFMCFALDINNYQCGLPYATILVHSQYHMNDFLEE